MSEIVVDAATRDKLLAAKSVVTIKDETGRVLGQFLKGPEYDPSEYEIPDHGMTEEELARALAPDAKVYSTAEVLAYLRSLK